MKRSTFTRAREARGLTAEDIARITRLSPRMIAAIEEERFDELPAGIYARSFIAAYAAAVGLDPRTKLQQVAPLLRDAPLDLLSRAELEKARPATGGLRYILAGAIDCAVLCAIHASIVLICAAVCGLPALVLLAVAPGSMALLCTTTAVLYFSLLGATDVRTAGPWLLDVEFLPRAEGPLAGTDLFRRAGTYAARELTLMFPWSSGKAGLRRVLPSFHRLYAPVSRSGRV